MSQATILEDTLKTFGGVESSLKRSHHESDQIGKSWSIVSAVMNTASAGAGVWLLGMTGVGQQVKSIYRELGEVSKMKELLPTRNAKNDLLSISNLLSFARDQGQKAGDKEFDSLTKNLKVSNLQLETLKWKNTAYKEYLKLADLDLKWLLLAGGVMTEMLASSRAMNQSLRESSASLIDRYALLGKIYNVQAATGASTNDMAAVVQSLVAYGGDLKDSFEEDATLVYQLHSALGLGSHQGAEMVNAFQRLGVNARDVGDGIARVVSDTSLSADEAARFATNLARAFAIMRPGVSQGSAAVAEYLGRIEGQLKTATGVTGELAEVYSKMSTTLEGAGVAHMLGVKNTESLASLEGAKQVTESLRSMVVNMTRGLTGDARLAVLTSLSEMTGVSTQALNALSDAMNRANGKIDKQRTLEDSWQAQLTSTGSSVASLISSLRFLAIRVIQPMLIPIQFLSKIAAQFVGFIGDALPVIVPILTVLAITAVPYLARQLKSLTITLLLLAAAAKNAARSATEAAIAQVAGGKGAGGVGLMDALKMLFSKGKAGLPGTGGIVDLMDATGATASKASTLSAAAAAKQTADTLVSTTVGLGKFGTWIVRTIPILGTFSTKLLALKEIIGSFGASMGIRALQFIPALIAFVLPAALVAIAALSGWAVGKMLNKIPWFENAATKVMGFGTITAKKDYSKQINLEKGSHDIVAKLMSQGASSDQIKKAVAQMAETAQKKYGISGKDTATYESRGVDRAIREKRDAEARAAALKSAGRGGDPVALARAEEQTRLLESINVAMTGLWKSSRDKELADQKRADDKRMAEQVEALHSFHSTGILGLAQAH